LLAVRTATGAPPVGSSARIGLEPAKTWVGLARVHLEVGDLRLAGEELLGEYRIRVPMRPSENDVGVIRLAEVDSIEQIQATGGMLVGDARSDYGKVHVVSCEVQPDGVVLIEVISGKRTLSFKTRLRALP
jgi:hypothetical protein